MSLIDREARQLFIDFSGFEDLAWTVIDEIDQFYTDHLNKILKHHPWITISEFGLDAYNQAWCIVHHSPNTNFQKECLSILESLLPSREALPVHYALLYDCVAITLGSKQRYGTQGEYSEEGKFHISPCEGSPEEVDKLRAGMELAPLKDSRKALE